MLEMLVCPQPEVKAFLGYALSTIYLRSLTSLQHITMTIRAGLWLFCKRGNCGWYSAVDGIAFRKVA